LKGELKNEKHYGTTINETEIYDEYAIQSEQYINRTREIKKKENESDIKKQDKRQKYTIKPKGSAANNRIPAKRIEREDTVG